RWRRRAGGVLLRRRRARHDARRGLMGAAAALLLLLLSATQATAAAAAPTGELTVALSSFATEVLDPALGGHGVKFYLALMFDYLIGVTPDGRLSPELGIRSEERRVGKECSGRRGM